MRGHTVDGKLAKEEGENEGNIQLAQLGKGPTHSVCVYICDLQRGRSMIRKVKI